MAIYRPPKARWPLATATAIGGALIGLLAGLAFGSEEFDAAESARRIRSILTTAAASVEVADVEYRESVDDGEVVAEAEFEGALAAVASSRSRFAQARPALDVLFPAHVEPIESLYDEIEQSMEAHADETNVTSLLQRLQAMLQGEIAP